MSIKDLFLVILGASAGLSSTVFYAWLCQGVPPIKKGSPITIAYEKITKRKMPLKVSRILFVFTALYTYFVFVYLFVYLPFLAFSDPSRYTIYILIISYTILFITILAIKWQFKLWRDKDDDN